MFPGIFFLSFFFFSFSFFLFPQFSLSDMALTQGSNTIYSASLSQEAAEAKDVWSFGRGVDFSNGQK